MRRVLAGWAGRAGCAVLCAVTLGGATAWAQSPPGAQAAQAEARTHFQSGARLYQSQHFDRAIEEFRTAYRLFPTPVILFNLAQAYREDGRLSEAVAAFRQFVVESPRLPDERRQDVETAISEIEAQRAVLRFEVEPAGAMLSVDGREVGTLPLPRGLELLPGEHTIALRLERHEPRSEAITLRAHEQRLYNATLRPTSQSARVVVTTVPEDAAIVVDGAEAGTGRVTRDLPPGDHTVTVSREGFRPYTRTVHLGTMASETMNVTLEARGHRLVSSPWFWAAVAGGVLLTGAGIWLATHPPEHSPIQGNTAPYVVQSVTSF